MLHYCDAHTCVRIIVVRHSVCGQCVQRADPRRLLEISAVLRVVTIEIADTIRQLHTHTQRHTYTHIHTHIYTHTYTLSHTHTKTHTHTTYTYTYTYTQTHKHTPTHRHTRTYMYTHAQQRIHTFVHGCISVGVVCDACGVGMCMGCGQP